MKRLMGLDIGEKRIGIALSDLLGLTAQGLETFHRTGDIVLDYQYLTELIDKHDVNELVIGLPKNMNNSLGFKAEEIKQFVEGFKDRHNLPIHWVDERLTTMSAEKMLIEADVSRKKRKNVVDKIAAVLILQLYLDMNR